VGGTGEQGAIPSPLILFLLFSAKKGFILSMYLRQEQPGHSASAKSRKASSLARRRRRFIPAHSRSADARYGAMSRLLLAHIAR